MGLRDDGQDGKLPAAAPRPGLANSSSSSLNEAWMHMLDQCVIEGPLNQVILPLMRNCFFAGAIYAVRLLQKGHGDQVVCDIAGFIMEEPQP
jgi:hypothetical protein